MASTTQLQSAKTLNQFIPGAAEDLESLGMEIERTVLPQHK